MNIMAKSTRSTVTIYNNGWNSYSCEYRGEGNAHLALSLPDINKILLIKKRDSKVELTGTTWDDSISFHNKIMRVMLEPFVSKVLKVQINKENVMQLENKIAILRPFIKPTEDDDKIR